jgi:hypothetical protein
MSRVAGQCLRKQTLRRWAHGWALSGSLAGALLTQNLLARNASAQEDTDAAETAAARALAVEGVKLADAGRCEEAIEKLTRAEKLHHALVVLGRLGECQVAQGKLVDGTENLRKVLREVLPPDAPPVLLKARERAQSVFDRAKLRIAALHITVKGLEDQTALTVMVNGQPINLALLDADRPTDPGEHLVEARAAGFFNANARVSLGAGDKQHVVIVLEPDPNAPVASTTAVANASGVPTAREPTSTVTYSSSAPESGAPVFSASTDSAAENEPDFTGAYIAWGVGGAALAVGSVFGLIAIDGKSDLDEQCPNNVCPTTSSDRLDSARGASTAATVLFVAGGASLALGTVLYFITGPSNDSPLENSAKSKSPAQARQASTPRAWIGLGQVGLSGEF